MKLHSFRIMIFALMGVLFFTVSSYAQEKTSDYSYVDDMKTVLGLTPQQVDAFRAVHEEYNSKFEQIVKKYESLQAPAREKYDIDTLRRLSDEQNAEIKQITDEYHQKLSLILNPYQMNKWWIHARQKHNNLMKALGLRR